MSEILLECCVGSPVSAVNAELGGAARVELCSALELGGLTPSRGSITLAREKTRIPLFVLVRPRGGGFHYTPLELDVMKDDIAAARELGADGIVLGTLRKDGSIDGEETAGLIEAARFITERTWSGPYPRSLETAAAVPIVPQWP